MLEKTKMALIEIFNLTKPFVIICYLLLLHSLCVLASSDELICKISYTLSIIFIITIPIFLIRFIKNIYLIFKKRYKNKKTILKLTFNLIFSMSNIIFFGVFFYHIFFYEPISSKSITFEELLFLIIIFAASAIYIYFYIQNIYKIIKNKSNNLL